MAKAWRRAYGALKDSTKVGLAKVNSEFKELDIAIVKATNHVECPPKERHVRKIFAATSAVRPRADIAYCIYALSRRLSKTSSWIVAVKTLIVIHRILREGDPTFREELLNHANSGNILQISHFKDDSSALALDCSTWLRTYALFLEERLECFRVLKYDIETEPASKTPQGAPKGHNRTRTLGCADLLEQLPALQQLLVCLISCQPEGAACGNFLVQYSLALVLKESFKIYSSINDGITNLVDMFFDMSKYDAIRALEMYKRSGQQAEELSDFYEFCRHLDLGRTFQFPTLRQPPPSFLATMEEYIREAPGAKKPDGEENNGSKEEETSAENENSSKEDEKQPSEEHEPTSEAPPEPEPAPQPIMGDLLGFDDISPVATELEENNALALAIVPHDKGNDPQPSPTLDLLGTTGWELALVTTPSSNNSQLAESKMGGGFNKLMLDSLYEDSARRQQFAATPYYGGQDANPFNSMDPFAMSNSLAPPLNVQMAMMAQQQQQLAMTQQQQQFYYQQQLQQQYYFQQHQYQYYQQQQMMMVPYQQQNSQPNMTGGANPFADSYGSSQTSPRQGNRNWT